MFGKPVYPPTASDCNLTNAEEEQSTLPSSTLHNRRPGTNNKTDADPDAHAGTTISEGSAVIPEENTEEEQLREKRREDIQRRTEIMHARYIESVQRIYHRYKGEFGYADRPLEIV